MEGDWRLEAGIPARLTPREGRKFGLTVGIAFGVLAGVSRWRGHDIAPAVLGGLGGLLLLGGLLAPGKLGPIHRGWMGFAHALSKITTPIFMGLVYFVVLTPTGLVMRLFGKRPLRAKEARGGFWTEHDPRSNEAGSLTRQF